MINGFITWLFYLSKMEWIFCFAETSVSELEEAFLHFTSRSDIAILLINQNVGGGYFFLNNN